MVLGRGQCREGGAENNGNGKHKRCLAEHFFLPVDRAGHNAVALSYGTPTAGVYSRPMRRSGLRRISPSCRDCCAQNPNELTRVRG